MYDAHIHLDFMSNGEEVAADAHATGVRLFASTVTPEGFVEARKRFSCFKNVDIGLGLHPWWVRSEEDTNAFLSLLHETKYISEIGLDFGKRHLDTQIVQKRVFERIVYACAESGGMTLSIHSVRSASEVLDVLQTTEVVESCCCILHWFTDSSDQLKRAIDLGCFFSVGMRMLNTGKGREYVKAIPTDRILLETDAPAVQGQTCCFSNLYTELLEAAQRVEAIKTRSTRVARR